MKTRRFLNVAIGQYYDGGSLGRIINPHKHLFFPSTAQAKQHQIQRAAAAKQRKITSAASAAALDEDCDGMSPPPPEKDYDVLRVATPKFRFKASSHPGGSTGMLDFFPFYSTGGGGAGDEERILCVDSNGMAALYDADAATIEVMPRLHEPKRWEPISFFVTHDAHPGALYVMDGTVSSFEALVYGDPDSPWSQLFARNDRHIWHWRRLPPAPLGVGYGRSKSSISIESYALLHGHDGGEDASSGSNTTICVSLRDSGSSSNSGGKAVPAGGTYCFDTGTGEWTKAGRWRLPFSSRALHVPELGNNLLFGIDGNNSDRFCAVDVLGAMRTNGSAPMLQHEWVDVYPLPNWSLQHHSVAYLGDGRFCIHRSFEVMEMDGWGSDYESVDTVVLLTGVEVVREGSKLRMVKHKSKRLDQASYNVF